MSQSSATQLLEDRNGFLWVGTPNGLNRYDGTSFKIFEKTLDGKIGLTDGYVEKLYEDAEGNLYIGTNQGLNLYQSDLNVVTPYPFVAESQFLQGKYFGAIARQDDYLWLGTDSEGVYRYNIKTGETKQVIFDEIVKGGPSNHYIVEVFPVLQDKLLIITQASIYLISNDLQVITQIDGLQNLSYAIEADDSGFLLGSHDGELIQLSVLDDYSFKTERKEISKGVKIASVAEDADQNIWMGTENDGLYILSPDWNNLNHYKSSVSKPNSISGNSIWVVYRAKNGVMWMGPYKNGLSFYDTEYRKFRHLQKDPFGSNSLSNNIVNCFKEDSKGNLWIGTDGGGLNYWDREANTYEHYSLSNGKLHSDVVLTLFEDDQKRLWVGSWANGVAIFDPKTKKFETWTKENSFLGSNNVIDIHQDRKGRMWFVTLFGGVHVYHPKTEKYRHVSLRSEKDGSEAATIARLLEDEQGQIWVGTQTKGLFKVVEENNRFTPVHYHSMHEKRTISNDFVNTLFQDNEGHIWVGTQAGLNRYQPLTDRFVAITKAEGLKDDAIRGIIQDKSGFLWLSTGNGITRFDYKNEAFVDYDVNDGLQGNEFNAASSILTSTGELAFGGSGGFNIFTPEEVKRRQTKPNIFISKLKIFNKEVLPGDELKVLTNDISQTDSMTLAYNLDVLNFEFHALTYRHPERVSFAYFLENFETEWNYVGDDKHATYTNLSPGEYILRIKSTNSDGVWVDNERTLHLTITPPFWQTWWFRSLLIGMVLFSAFKIHQSRVTKMERYQVRLETEIAARTKELRLQKKKLLKAADTLTTRNEEIQRFAFAVSHDLKSPLNSIKGIASLIPMELDIEDKPELKDYIKYIDETCDTMTNLITDISEIARLGKIENRMEVLDTNEVLDLASNLVMGRLLENNTSLIVDAELPEIFGDHNRILQVFENLIDNAIKFMGDQKLPVVKVEAKRRAHYNEFAIIDNGSGMDKRALDKLFTPFERFDGSVEGSGLGLYMVQKIIESHGGDIWATSEGKGKGSTFVVQLPITIDKKELKSSIQTQATKS
ncbi:histidine kinase [Muricauda sp. DJ-13]|uniref:histidine kinase n=2 Tax=Croceivirga thetidis TaxID=2721623 RepID=A0ABX1GTK0_9FLAO|nr:histidine kinase [Croceivirga thetidis]